uniref:Uncharacterized protein n=1 Tax=Periophthalmus magnuspinnatus TaxID=409849 RepID=A0A3B4A4D7_9GOBI
MPIIVGATGSRGRITSSTLHTPNHTSDGENRKTLSSYRPGESGFTNNQRLVLGYRPPLDLIDNPQYGSLLFDNYITQTKWHYQPYVYNDGSGSKPSLFYKRESGFFQLNVPPKPLCQNEKSEYQSLYVTHPLVPTVSPEKIINIGLKGDSGFTKGEDLQINTFTNKTCTPCNIILLYSIFVNVFQGSKVIPNLRSHACRETGYTRGTNAPLACPVSHIQLSHKLFSHTHF